MSAGNIRTGSSNLNSSTAPGSLSRLPPSPFASQAEPSGVLAFDQRTTPHSASAGHSRSESFLEGFRAHFKARGINFVDLLKKAGMALTGISFDAFSSLQNHADPADANNISQASQDQAADVVEMGRTSEDKAIQALTSAQQTAYQNVRDQVTGNPMALKSLQKLLLSGRLTGEPLAAGGATLLSQLQGMSQQPLAAGIDRRTWMEQMLIEIDDPVRVNQHAWNTCGATTAQILLLRKNPAEYARLQGGLASPDGNVTMMGGDTLAREANWNVGVSPHNGDIDQRTISAQLFQSAVMELGNGFGFVDYDAAKDVHKPAIKIFGFKLPQFGVPGMPGGIPGIPSVGMENILKQLTGENYENRTPLPWQREGAWNETKRALAEGRGPVSTVLLWQGEVPHYVQIDRIVGDRVHFTNPWGLQQSLSEREFYDHILQLQIQQA
ncbi:MAG: hypothetical protein VKN33_05120 [Candidatus Sericytochromatia bacterium]|nr:hypothetical protein [Candidatus Sericytochromatia bacterium]